MKNVLACGASEGACWDDNTDGLYDGFTLPDNLAMHDEQIQWKEEQIHDADTPCSFQAALAPLLRQVGVTQVIPSLPGRRSVPAWRAAW